MSVVSCSSSKSGWSPESSFNKRRCVDLIKSWAVHRTSTHFLYYRQLEISSALTLAAPSSSPLTLNPKSITTRFASAPAQDRVGSSVATTMQRNHRKRSAQRALFQDGGPDEDCEIPTKRFKILKTSVSVSMIMMI
jgi:hypothetical protein